MKVAIDHNGQMTISADTSLESYALNKWAKENIGNDPLGNAYFRSILIDCAPPRPPLRAAPQQSVVDAFKPGTSYGPIPR